MTPTRYILLSLRHHRFAYLGVLAGAVLGATVLLGALFAGDSVEASLRRIGENRTGRATHVVAAGDRFFRQALAGDLASAAGVRAAPLVYARGTAAHGATRAVVNQAQLVGVTEAFWQLAPVPGPVPLDAATSAVAINETLARRLSLAVGDALIVRLQKPGTLAGNAPVAGAESTLQSLRCNVAAIVGDASFGRFSLDTSQMAQPTVFLPIRLLQESIGHPGGANLLLIEAAGSEANLKGALARTVRLADYGLALKWLEPAAVFEISSSRIFIDPELAEAVIGAMPGTQPVVSYLVNEFRLRERSTPYSIATATTREAAPFLPPDLGPRDIVLNDWLAADLQASAGDEVRLTYFQAGAAGALIEQQAAFRVHSVVPMQGLAADRAWMPDFPGMSDAKTTSEWDPGLPLKLDLIRDKDERYWDDFRGAPKAFLSPAAGRGIWSTRWGNYTALRIPFARDREAALVTSLLSALRPEMNQLILRNFGAGAAGAMPPAVDFGGLFVGMSFFLIVAALGLVAMLFQFCLLQRNREDALLAAVGLSGRQLLRWRLVEGFVILLGGCLIGLPLAMLYTRGILRFLESIWAGQGTAATFVFAARPGSIAVGSAVFLLLSVLAIWLAIRQQARRTLSIRLAAHAEETAPLAGVRRSSLVIAVVAVAIGAAALGLSGRGLPAQGAFYLGGFALLAAGIATYRWRLAVVKTGAPATGALVVPASADNPERRGRLKPEPPTRPLDASYLGGLNLQARRSRSLTVVGLIATAVFMVLSVASFRKQVGADWLEHGSGTGGFAFWLETTAALNAARDGRSTGFEIFEGPAGALGEIVPIRAGVGDNANCFNLNTTAQPQLLAVDAAKLAARRAFPLTVPARERSGSGWSALSAKSAAGAIPALVDETTLLWALKRKVGDVLRYTDENGRPFEVQIVGTLRDSIFQGYLLLDERLFLEKFPSHPGYAIFLVDAANAANLGATRQRLEAAIRDVGGRVDLTREVLAAFHQIENTYIAIFNVLGSLGVILGSLGLAIVVARNLRERRGEFAVMTAMGIPRGVLARMVFSEYSRLVLWGIAIGALASALAVWPNITALPAGPTLLLVTGLLVGIVALNLASGWAIFSWSLRDLRPSVEQAGP
jgi:ABC-type lipoprotein release transport system permease subunit